MNFLIKGQGDSCCNHEYFSTNTDLAVKVLSLKYLIMCLAHESALCV